MTEEHHHEHAHEAHHESHAHHAKKSPASTFAYGIGAAVVIAIAAVYSIARIGVWQASPNPFVVETAKFFKMPIAEVNGQRIAYADYAGDMKALLSFYAKDDSGVFPKTTPQEASDQVISRLIANVLIEKVAKDYVVEVTQEDLNKIKEQLIQQLTSEDAARKEIMFRYGFTLEEFLQKVVLPSEREQKLIAAFDAKNKEKNETLDFKSYMDQQLKKANIRLFAKIHNPLAQLAG